MSADWDRGVFTAEKNASSWHNFAQVGDMQTAADLLTHGYESGALPIMVQDGVSLFTETGLTTSMASATVASYANHPDRIVGVNGGRYRACQPEEYAALVADICRAGGRPSGVFSLANGTRVLSTFRVGDEDSHLETHILLADAFDGSMHTVLGFTTMDVICANTLAIAWSQDGADWGKVRHTASAEERLPMLGGVVADAIASGRSVADLYTAAQNTVLTPEQSKAAFDAMFPAAPETASKAAQTKAENVRNAARRAAQLPINRRGHRAGNLATLWNTATFLVDRDERGNERKTRGKDALSTLLFGSRGQRVQEVLAQVEVIMADGSVQAMSVPEATAAGVDSSQMGSSLLQSILDDM